MKNSGHPVLLVVDMQSGLFSAPSPELHDAAGILSRVAELIDSARSLGVPIIYTRFIGPPGSPLAEGDPASAIHATVAPRVGELVIPKDDSDAFLRTDLGDRLKELGAAPLIVCGLQSEFCIDSTCRTAYALGHRVVLVGDAHTTANSGPLTGAQIAAHHNRTLARVYVTVAPASEIFTPAAEDDPSAA
jgi:nicotinamidase-related amidase